MRNSKVVVQVWHDVFVSGGDDDSVKDNGVQRPYVDGVNLPGSDVTNGDHDDRRNEIDQL